MSATWGAIAALAIFAMTATFYAGVMWQRMNDHDKWRLEVRADFLQLRAALDELKELLLARTTAHGRRDGR